MNYEKRRSVLLDTVSADAFLVLNIEESDRVSLFYLTGFTGEGALLLTQEGTTLLTDSRYTEQAKREIPALPVTEVKGSYLEGVADLCKERGIAKIAFAASRMSHATVLKLREMIEGELISCTDPVADLRRIKGPEEIDRIRGAVHLAEESLTTLMPEIEVGMSERELALRLEFIMRENGAEKVAFDLIVAAGEDSALPHYQPGTQRIKEGDLLLFDIGARLNGYCSDMTRVFTVGRPTTQAQEIYGLVLAANMAGIAAVRAGESGVAGRRGGARGDRPGRAQGALRSRTRPWGRTGSARGAAPLSVEQGYSTTRNDRHCRAGGLPPRVRRGADRGPGSGDRGWM